MFNPMQGRWLSALVGVAGLIGGSSARGDIILSPQYGAGYDAVFLAVGLHAGGAEPRDFAWSVGVGPPILYGSWDVSLQDVLTDPRGWAEGSARAGIRTAADLRHEGMTLLYSVWSDAAGSGSVSNYVSTISLTFETTEPLPYTVLAGSGTGARSQGVSLWRMAYRDHLLWDSEVFRLGEAAGTSVVTGVLMPGLYQISTLNNQRPLNDNPWTWMQFGMVPTPSSGVLLAAGILAISRRGR